MKFFQAFSSLSKKEIMISFIPILILSNAIIFHFLLEFSAIRKLELSYIFVILHFIGLPVGIFLNFKVLWKLNYPLGLISGFGLLTISFIILIVFNHPIIIFISLFVAGVSIGYLDTIMFEIMSVFCKDPKFNGRINSIGTIVYSFLLIFGTIIDYSSNQLLYILFFVLIFFIYLGIILVSKSTLGTISSDKTITHNLLNAKLSLPITVFSIFWGFFFVNTYYSTVLILEMNNLRDNLNLFLIIFFASMLVSSFPCGFLMDIIGRRIIITLGCLIQALAFLLLSIYGLIDIILFLVFPIILGIGFIMTINGGLVIWIESLNKGIIFAFIGMVLGAFLGEFLINVIVVEPVYLTLILLFIFVGASIVIFQLEETLPSRSEIYKRPDKLTEEEVTLYREQKICLVCKNKVPRVLYLCPKCDALYCVKCSDALSNLENMCWVCNTPIDETKPVKPQVVEEDKIEVDSKTDVKKQKKG